MIIKLLTKVLRGLDLLFGILNTFRYAATFGSPSGRTAISSGVAIGLQFYYLPFTTLFMMANGTLFLHMSDPFRFLFGLFSGMIFILVFFLSVFWGSKYGNPLTGEDSITLALASDDFPRIRKILFHLGSSLTMLFVVIVWAYGLTRDFHNSEYAIVGWILVFLMVLFGIRDPLLLCIGINSDEYKRSIKSRMEAV